MSWFRVCSAIFAFWAILFFFFPKFANEFAGIGYEGSRHAEDWTRIVGLFSLAFAILLNEAHRSKSPQVRRVVARAALAFTLPCALLMTYWQLIPDRRWIRLDIINILLLYVMSFGLLVESKLLRQKENET